MSDAPSVEELEKLYAAPDTEGKTEPEWLPTCLVFLSPESNERCNADALVNLTLSCPFCGYTRAAYCVKHCESGIAGRLSCRPCTRKAKTPIYKHPVSCIWKSDES